MEKCTNVVENRLFHAKAIRTRMTAKKAKSEFKKWFECFIEDETKKAKRIRQNLRSFGYYIVRCSNFISEENRSNLGNYFLMEEANHENSDSILIYIFAEIKRSAETGSDELLKFTYDYVERPNSPFHLVKNVPGRKGKVLMVEVK